MATAGIVNMTREVGYDVAGTLPTQIGLVTSLRLMDLGVVEGNERLGGLSGTLPTEIGRLTALHTLRLGPAYATEGCVGVNSLSGTLPRELALIPSMEDLDLRCNDFVYPNSPEVAGLVEYQAVQALCDQRGICQGVPPETCSAFDAVSSLTNLRQCIPCEDVPVGLVIFGIISALLAVIGVFGAYIALMIRHPELLKKWGSTIEIIFSRTRHAIQLCASIRFSALLVLTLSLICPRCHTLSMAADARTMVILSRLQVEWPKSVQAILAGPDLTILPKLLE